jgi:hypothetical protein
MTKKKEPRTVRMTAFGGMDVGRCWMKVPWAMVMQCVWGILGQVLGGISWRIKNDDNDEKYE